jgi:Ser/Thr protein kinase RdoA (MazF antagonist)
MSVNAADIEFEPPNIELDLIVDHVKSHYGVDATPTQLRGERDQNVLLEGDDVDSVLVKVSSHSETAGAIDLQIRVLSHLEHVAPDLVVPRMVPSTAGYDRTSIVDVDGQEYSLRVLTFVEGEPFGGEPNLSRSILESVGQQQGLLAKALADFEHPSARRFMAWDIGNGLIADSSLWTNLGADVVEVIGQERERLGALTLPALRRARSQVVHNDGHSGNVLRRAGTLEVHGVIDFGDMVFGAVVSDLAIAASGFCDNGADGIVDAITSVAKGFHDIFPLLESEVELLYDAVLARYVLTMLLFDYQLAQDTGRSDYVHVARPHALRELRAWLDEDREDVTAHVTERLRP